MLTLLPQLQDVPWIDHVDWHIGYVFDNNLLARTVEGVTGASLFGDNEFIKRCAVMQRSWLQKAVVERFVCVLDSRVGS
ncbi:uncharacterized protein PHALS_06845 [Plasmopara halstedii]|uniref:Uncharacterized protein n=1 Tax=Plasmopara halstedii TaxID=4781 RepID=A0A0P1B5K2_PLAHL|nr:uncharacterized protein PHALS_06845 [Plasmopara halstedii]CEG49058.1 hypothetical protein PHALS_06845 [Plasmopara halstedii]|eukprot:XP_024585427.1 hypothetical protein PHALS_06845 [Plasmopara halstedii]